MEDRMVNNQKRVLRLGIYSNHDAYTFPGQFIAQLAEVGAFDLVYAGRLSVTPALLGMFQSLEQGRGTVAPRADIPRGVEQLESKWLFVNQTDAAVIFLHQLGEGASLEPLSYVTSYVRRLLQTGEGRLLVIAPDPDKLSEQLLAACDDHESIQFKALIDSKALSFKHETDVDCLRALCEVRWR